MWIGAPLKVDFFFLFYGTCFILNRNVLWKSNISERSNKVSKNSWQQYWLSNFIVCYIIESSNYIVLSLSRKLLTENQDLGEVTILSDVALCVFKVMRRIVNSCFHTFYEKVVTICSDVLSKILRGSSGNIDASIFPKRIS